MAFFFAFLEKKHIRVLAQHMRSYEMWLKENAMLYPHAFYNKLGTDFRWLDLPAQWLVTMHATSGKIDP